MDHDISYCNDFQMYFGHILETDADNMGIVFNDGMDMLRECAVAKKIDFDGYFGERLEESAESIISFDDDYFDDQPKRNLYVFLSAKVDDQIFENLSYVWQVVKGEDLTHEILDAKLEHYKKAGVRF